MPENKQNKTKRKLTKRKNFLTHPMVFVQNYEKKSVENEN